MTEGKAFSKDVITTNFQQTMNLLRKTLIDHSPLFDASIDRLEATGWDLDTAVLETKPGRRLALLD